MKKILFILFISLFLARCSKEEVPKIITSITFDKNEVSIKIGDVEELKVNHFPSDLLVPIYTWESSNNDIATVTNGKVTGISVGEATVKVTATELGLTISCKINVYPVEAETIILNTTNQELKLGDEFQLTAIIEPENTTNKSISWESSDEKVATVTDKGLVKAIGIGKAIITVNSGNISVLCNIEVTPIHITGISLSHEDIEIEVTDKFELQVTVSPEDATNKKIIWISSNEKTATVSENGMILGVGKGQAVITAKTEDGNYTAECRVVVTDIKVKGISLNHSNLKLVIGENKTLSATVSPANAADKSVTWTSNNSSVASIDQNGNLSALSNGSTVITAKTNDGAFQASCNVTVSTLEKLVTIIAQGQSIQQASTGFYVTFHSRFTNPTSKPIQILAVYLTDYSGKILQSQIGAPSVLVNNGSQYYSFNLMFFQSSSMDNAFIQMLEQHKVVYQFVSEGRSYQVEQNINARGWGNI